LEDVLFDECEEVDEGVVPGDAVEGEDEGEEPEEDFDAEDLGRGLLVRLLETRSRLGERTGKAISRRMTMPAATAMAACL
jgi:hypothetical protein